MISVVDIHDPTATPILHDPNYTLHSNINIAGLFYIRYTQLLFGAISNITSVIDICEPNCHTNSLYMVSLAILVLSWDM